MKYIIADVNGKILPVVFPNELVHRCIFEGMHHSARHEASNWSCKLISAGFVDLFLPDGVLVYGQSDSLNQKSRQEDAEIIKNFFLTET